MWEDPIPKSLTCWLNNFTERKKKQQQQQKKAHNAQS